MATAKLTLTGLNQYMADHDDDLFSALRTYLPTGIDADIVINQIILNGGEFEVMYPNPYLLQNLIGSWTKKNRWTFDKWYKAINIEYDPLYNYDRHEKWIDSDSGTTSGSSSGSRTRTDQESRSGDNSNSEQSGSNSIENESGNISRTNRSDIVTNNAEHVNGSSNSDTTNTVSAFNSSTYEPDNKSVNGTETTTTTAGTGSTSGSGSDEESSGSVKAGSEAAQRAQNGTYNELSGSTGAEQESGETSGTHDNIGQHEGRMYGNIGVTTSQQMLQAELDLAFWNLYDHIADMFISEFTIPVYI